MRYRILGPLSVTDGTVSAGRDRVVLAMLLLHPGRVVGVGVLADAVWGADPPATARGQLQTCVSRLRRVLPAGAIRSDPAGYRLDPAPGELDAAEFGRLAKAGREERDPAKLRQGLDLWRGDALAGIESHAVQLAAAVLDQQRVAAVQDWAQLELETGGDQDLIGELTAAVDRWPLQEKLSGQLMLALHHAGRPAEALAEYQRARTALRDELGVDPGPELQDLHAGMLKGSLPRRAEAVRCLPRTVGDFVGRAVVVARLIARIEQGGPAPAVAVIDGMAGSGKTTLALHVAALIGDRYPDAHLFVDLHGHSAERPVEPAAALLVLLRQLGVEAERIPSALVDRIGLWRTELAKRRVLVLFDNAASSAQVADLLPTDPGSLALVTGRRRLFGLDGVHTESLPVLAPGEGVALLARIAGERVGAEPEAAAEVVRRCGGLPLAIRLAGARLAHRPRWRVADLLRRLRESALPELAAEERSVVSAFALSFDHLTAPARQVFRLLGVCPGADADILTVAALSGLPLDAAQEAVDDLIDVHLLEEREPEVYRLHDLLREFATVLAGELAPEERIEALRGALDQQLHAAAATNVGAFRQRLDRDIGSPAPLRPDLLAAVTDPAARLERERPALLRYIDAAAGEPELARYAWQLARASWLHLFRRGYPDDIRATHQRALEVTERIGDRAATAAVLNYMASAHFRRAEVDEATRLLERSLALRRELGDQEAIRFSLVNLANVYHNAGRWTNSVELALEVRRMPSPRMGRGSETDELNAIALGCQRLGRYAEALRYERLRLLKQVETGDRVRIGDCLASIAVVKYRLGLIGGAAARRQLMAGLRQIQRGNSPYAEAEAYHDLALIVAREGDLEEAIALHHHALEIALPLADPRQGSRLHHGLGTTLLLAGDRENARVAFEEALRLGWRFRLAHGVAVAEAGLAECLIDEDPAEARRLFARAATALAAIEAPELTDVEKFLAELGGEDHRRAGAGGETIRT
ncbi:BTAD domain-containing putative transcriptional regulator [Actinoplanes sp. NPDC048988]|uniref:AfsR/SARP family transcriptional regulator n=1 Tax=Actinoplanes sp. NPDC048988 TaxID=3363901 RepID=UPI00371B47AA